MTTPAPDLGPFRAILQRWEGRVPWLYRDSTPEGNATVGIGCLLPSLAASQSLPWMLQVLEYPGTPPVPASPYDVLSDWRRVMGLPPSRLADAYRDPARRVFLLDAAIDTLADVRIRGAIASLRARYADWDALPPDCQLVLVDLEFNLGAGKAAQFVKLRAAVEARAWGNASVECITVNAGQTHEEAAARPRNAWRVATMAHAGSPAVA